jgi:hypothetical protein
VTADAGLQKIAATFGVLHEVAASRAANQCVLVAIGELELVDALAADRLTAIVEVDAVGAPSPVDGFTIAAYDRVRGASGRMSSPYVTLAGDT